MCFSVCSHPARHTACRRKTPQFHEDPRVSRFSHCAYQWKSKRGAPRASSEILSRSCPSRPLWSCLEEPHSTEKWSQHPSSLFYPFANPSRHGPAIARDSTRSPPISIRFASVQYNRYHVEIYEDQMVRRGKWKKGTVATHRRIVLWLVYYKQSWRLTWKPICKWFQIE